MRIALILVLLLANLNTGFAGPARPIQVTVDGKPVTFEKPPVMQRGTVMVPARGIFEALGGAVKFDSGANKLRATRGDLTVEMVVGAWVASIRGQLTPITTPAARINGAVMVPLRFVVDLVGAEMKLASATNTYEVKIPQVVVATPKGPRIEQVVHNAKDGLDVGRSLQVVVLGEASAQGTFEIVGIVSGVPLHEEAPGRYTGALAVTPALKIDKGRLVVRLTKDDLETAKEADRPVSLALPAALALLPAAGATVPTDALTVGATFKKKVRPNSVRLVLDGSDVTDHAQATPEGVSFKPDPATVGAHEATLDAITEDGQFIRKTWRFTVIASTAQAPTPPPVPVPSPTPPPVAATDISFVAPAEGSTVQTRRPAIQIQLTQAVKPESVLVTVDGQRVDAAVSNSGTTVSVNLAADIAPGDRQTTFAATDVNGKPVAKSWTFSVAAPTPSGPPALSVLSPSPGGTVRGSFHIKGVTRAKATVRVTVITTESKKLDLTTTADASGNFDLLVDEKQLEKSTSLSLEIVAVDHEGQESPPVKLSVKRS